MKNKILQLETLVRYTVIPSMFLGRDSREPCLFLYFSSCFHVVFLFITLPSDSAVLERSNNVSPNRRSVCFTIPSRVELLFC